MTEPTTSPDVFDLDALEREGGAKETFTFRIEGEAYTLVDPAELDYRDVLIAFRAANANDFETAFGRLMPPDDRDAFAEHAIPAWKLEKLFEAYSKHYGLTSGKSRRSSRS